MCKKSFENYQLSTISMEGKEHEMRGKVLLSLLFFLGMKHWTERRTDYLPTPSLDPKCLLLHNIDESLRNNCLDAAGEHPGSSTTGSHATQLQQTSHEALLLFLLKKSFFSEKSLQGLNSDRRYKWQKSDICIWQYHSRGLIIPLLISAATQRQRCTGETSLTVKIANEFWFLSLLI